MKAVGKEVTIVMVEDDEGHARLIEKNVRRAGVNNEIIPFTNGTEALDFILGKDRSGTVSMDRYLQSCSISTCRICPARIFSKKSNPIRIRVAFRSSS